jgi:hypothetical protein
VSFLRNFAACLWRELKRRLTVQIGRIPESRLRAFLGMMKVKSQIRVSVIGVFTPLKYLFVSSAEQMRRN